MIRNIAFTSAVRYLNFVNSPNRIFRALLFSAIREISLLKELKHPNIVGLQVITNGGYIDQVCQIPRTFISAADLDHFDADPDPAFNFDTDPDPTFHFDRTRIRILTVSKR
jgi:hypothetical protein